MGKRSTGRKLAMQLLYQSEMRQPLEPQLVAELFWGQFEFSEPVKEWAMELTLAAWQCKQDLDNVIQTYSIGWSLKRIHPLDKSLLRLALYEIMHTPTDHKIVINEVVELAKRYSGEESSKFINGILGSYLSTCLPVSSED